MHADDRVLLVDLASAVLGSATRAHSWPWLVDDAGAPLVLDGFWPDRCTGLAVVPRGEGDRWRHSAAVAALHRVVLLLLDEPSFPCDDDGRVLGAAGVLSGLLDAAGLPTPGGGADGPTGATAGTPVAHDGPAATPPTGWGAYTSAGGSDTNAEHRHDPPDRDLERPWADEELAERMHDEDPWGAEDDGDEAFSTDDASAVGPSREGREPGWDARSVVLAALGATGLARTLFAHRRLRGLEPLELEVLLATWAAGWGDGSNASRPSSTRGLAAALALQERTVHQVLGRLSAQDLLVADDHVAQGHRLSGPGAQAVRGWLADAGPAFGRWPSSPSGAHDAS